MSMTMRGLVLAPHQAPPVELLEDLARPTPAKGEVLVRVTHTTVNGHEFDLAEDRLVRLLGWLSRAPGRVRTGLEFSGVVETPGARFSAGDAVMGYVDVIAGWKPHAEYLAIPESYIALSPKGLPAAEAAALPMSAQTALVGLREAARVQPGHHLLVLGASGGVGVMAVQIARILGAHVTAFASAKHHDLLTSLGAARTVDYRSTALSRLEGAFDAVLDFSSTAYLREVEHLLAPQGVFVPADPMRNLLDIVRSRRAKWLMVDKGDGDLLREIAGWVEQGELRPVIDEVFELADWQGAVTRGLERGRAGRTVLHFG